MPGKHSAPAHYHTLEEEHVYILEGALTVRIGADTFEMKAGDYVCFPAGQKAEHCLINNSGAACRYVIMGERNPILLVIPPFVKQIIATAVTDTFALGLYVLVAAAIVTLLIPNIRLRDRAAMREAVEVLDDPNAGIPAEAHL